MYQFHKLFRWSWSILVMLALAFAMAGCDGKDGAPGRDGTDGMDGMDGVDGVDGQDGTSATITPLESCGVCHDAGSFADATDYHDVSGVDAIVGSFADFAVAPDGLDLVVSFSVTVDGALETGATFYRAYFSDGVVRTNWRDEILDNPDRFVNNGDGTYSVRIVDGVARFGGTDGRYLVILKAGANELEVAAVGDYPNPLPLAGLAAAEACVGCHGPSGEGTLFDGRFNPRNRGGHYSAPMSADACVVCHRPDDPSTPDEDEEPSYMRLVRVVHGIHNSHNFPDGVFENPERGSVYDVTYPTYMTNCSVCHKADDILPGPDVSALAAANAMPVSQGCFTCHGSMDSWATWFQPGGGPGQNPAGLDLTIHFSLAPTPETSNCASCHNNEPPPVGPGVAANKLTVADSHNGLTTGRGGIIWDGEDTSVTEGAKFVWEILGVEVVDAGANLAISWQASYEGAQVDPCNADLALGPTFHAAVDADGRPTGNLSMLRNYAQGDDFILGMSTSAPGQALAVNVTTTNTECLVANVATTTIPADDVTAERGIVALQGKPRTVSPDPAGPAEGQRVRAKTPTYEFMTADGSAPAETRRDIVDADACLTCHVGSLYQHGGNRVDNPGMCILCHNSASNEKNVRTATMGIDVPADTYDGKVGETYELKTMLHRVHSAGVAGQPPYVIYRGRGVYAFAPDRSGLANWPGEGSQEVFGSTIGNVEDGVQLPPPYVTPHNFHAVTYPRALNNCEACHSEGSVDFQPDQTKAMATTLDAGSSEWANQLDDVLQGATTTACVTCHTDGPAKGHAYQNGWEPQEFPEGRKTIIDAVTQ